MKYTIVMPIIQYSYINDPELDPTEKHNNFERFAKISLPTLMKHVVWSDVHSFIFIIKRDEEAALEAQLPVTLKRKVQVQLLYEEDVIPKPKHGKNTTYEKYRIQMMSKLLVAKYVHTPYYLLLDDDIVAVRKFSYKDLFVGTGGQGRAQLRYTHDPVYHENWWKASAEILGMDWSDAEKALKHTRMGVTPDVLSTHETKNLLAELDIEKTMVAQGRWTEYTLMWLYLIKHGKLDSVYKRGHLPFSEGSTNIWMKSDNLGLALKTLFNNKKQWFGVIQSNVYDHTVERVLENMGSHVNS